MWVTLKTSLGESFKVFFDSTVTMSHYCCLAQSNQPLTFNNSVNTGVWSGLTVSGYTLMSPFWYEQYRHTCSVRIFARLDKESTFLNQMLDRAPHYLLGGLFRPWSVTTYWETLFSLPVKNFFSSLERNHNKQKLS